MLKWKANFGSAIKSDFAPAKRLNAKLYGWPLFAAAVTRISTARMLLIGENAENWAIHFPAKPQRNRANTVLPALPVIQVFIYMPCVNIT